MRQTDLKEVTGKTVKGWYEWLRANDCGCCSVYFEGNDKYRYCVCMGWHDNGTDENGKQQWVVAWKIGRQTHNNAMQCDFDVDFEMPYVTEEMAKAHPDLYCAGDVDSTLETVECARIASGPHKGQWGKPAGYLSWEALATQMRKTARRVWRDWRKEAE